MAGGAADMKGEGMPAMRETWVRSLGPEDPLENGMATHLSIHVNKKEESGRIK